MTSLSMVDMDYRDVLRRQSTTPEGRPTPRTGISEQENTMTMTPGKVRMMKRGSIDATTAAEYLSVSLRTIQRLTAAGEIRAVRYGRIVRYRPEDLDSWLEMHLDAA